MNKIFLVSDTHFNHKNIIKYCDRPFKDIKEMNETIINNWNKVIDKEDIVYHLGDFGFGTKEELKNIFDRLNGKKYLIMGNHDHRVGKKYYEELGFIEVYKKECRIDNFIFTHRPIDIEDNYFNYYGHIHNNLEEEKYLDDKHKCICLEKTNYYPIELKLK